MGWIEDTVRVILERCRILVEAADSGESHPSVRLPIINPRPNAPGSSQQPFSRYDKGTERERLVENARKILAGGFKPSHIMTDKSLTQINALLRGTRDCFVYSQVLLLILITSLPRHPHSDLPVPRHPSLESLVAR